MNFLPALLCLHNTPAAKSQICNLFPFGRILVGIPGKRRPECGLTIKTVQRTVFVLHHPHTSQIVILRHDLHNRKQRISFDIDPHLLQFIFRKGRGAIAAGSLHGAVLRVGFLLLFVNLEHKNRSLPNSGFRVQVRQKNTERVIPVLF